MHNGDQNALPSWLYPKKYFNESLLSNFLFDNAIPLISTSLISISFLLLWKALLMMLFSPNIRLLVPFLYYEKKNIQNLLF